MQYFKKENVYEAAIKRIEWLFDEFDYCVVSFSGGKDSTVVFNLAMEIAKRKGRLPLPVLWIDQEIEAQSTVDYVKEIMYRPDVKPYWLQVPYKYTNATSHEEGYMYCWKEGEKWMREKDDIAIKENVYGVDRFKPLFDSFLRKEFAGYKACSIGGVRAEESPGRRLSLTGHGIFKGETWGKTVCIAENKYTFYPVYDWSYTDIWHYIAINNIPYNKMYDMQYQYGEPIKNMRVSSLNHEMAIGSMRYIQELEGDTWNKMVERLDGVNSMKHAYISSCPEKLPFMFKTWKEYRDYLLEHLVSDKYRQKFEKKFKSMDVNYERYIHRDEVFRVQIATMILNDHEFTTIAQYESGHHIMLYKNSQKKAVKWR